MKSIKRALRHIIYRPLVGNSDKKRVARDSMKKILIVPYSFLGDMIVTSPLIREMRKVFPDATIDIWAHERNVSILKYNPYIDHIYLRHESMVKNLGTIRALRNVGYDLVLDMNGARIYMAWLFAISMISARMTIGLRREERHESKVGYTTDRFKVYDHIVGNDLHKRLKDRMLEAVTIFSDEEPDGSIDFYLSDAERKKADLCLSEIGENLPEIGVTYVGSRKDNSMTAKQATDLLKRLADRIDRANIVLFHPPQKRDEASRIIEDVGCDRVKLSCRTESIQELGALIEKCTLIVTTGTSTMHIASAFDKKMVVVHPDDWSYKAFEPETKGGYRTVFSHSTKNIESFDIGKVVDYAVELLEKPSEEADRP
jgi:ADP-heptose:LPS heptosyltransferase